MLFNLWFRPSAPPPLQERKLGYPVDPYLAENAYGWDYGNSIPEDLHPKSLHASFSFSTTVWAARNGSASERALAGHLGRRVGGQGCACSCMLSKCPACDRPCAAVAMLQGSGAAAGMHWAVCGLSVASSLAALTLPAPLTVTDTPQMHMAHPKATHFILPAAAEQS
jgi:hypothetical protein